MNDSVLRSRPPGVVAVIALTLLYCALYPTAVLFPLEPRFLSAFLAVSGGLATAYLLWRGWLLGWGAAVALYGLLLFDFAVGASVLGLAAVPEIVVPAVVLAYLILARERVIDARLFVD